jgi:small subunit ribosomal protein S17
MAEPQKSLNGKVVSAKMQKTVVVQVDHTMRHRLYHKIMKRSKRYLAHDDHLEAKVGDKVRITEMRPMSRLKRWRISEIIERGEVAEVQAREIDSAYLALHREREAPPVHHAAAETSDIDAAAPAAEEPEVVAEAIEAAEEPEVVADAIEAAEAVASTEVLAEEVSEAAVADEEQTEQP